LRGDAGFEHDVSRPELPCITTATLSAPCSAIVAAALRNDFGVRLPRRLRGIAEFLATASEARRFRPGVEPLAAFLALWA